MSLTLCNGTAQRTISCCYMFYSPDDCGGYGDFQMIGWWNLAPGQCAQVYANNLNDVQDTNWFVYAVDFSDNTEWAGPYDAVVPRTRAFNQCFGTGVGAGNETWEVKFLAFDKGNSDNSTVNFAD